MAIGIGILIGLVVGGALAFAMLCSPAAPGSPRRAGRGSCCSRRHAARPRRCAARPSWRRRRSPSAVREELERDVKTRQAEPIAPQERVAAKEGDVRAARDRARRREQGDRRPRGACAASSRRS